MHTRCPGQDTRELLVELYKSGNCGAEVEIFSDEVSLKCRKCGEKIYSDMGPSCIEWCASAPECLGKRSGVS